jgi:uncharacterized protein YprB with RNaseH-like and TPR domain
MLYLDIETSRGAPDPTWELDFPIPEPPTGEPAPDKRLKDPDKIAADIESKRAKRAEGYAEAIRERDQKLRERWEQTPLEALHGRVLCIGIARDDAAPTVLWKATEEETLKLLDAGLSKYPGEPVCAYRGIQFDFLFIARRALKYGLFRLAGRLYQPKPFGGSRAHVDPYLAWSGPERNAKGRLVDVARFLGVEVTETVEGKRVPELWHEVSVMAADEPRRVEVVEQIRAHVVEDVRVLREVHQRMDAAGWC